MKRFIALLLAVSLCLSLWACGSEPEVRTQPTTEVTTEPIPDIIIRTMVPEDWSEPACAVWEEGSADAVEGSMQSDDKKWFFLKVPGVVTGVRIGGNGGTVTTGDLTIEAGKDVWIHVVNPDYAFVHYEEPSQEQLDAEVDKPALDYHETFRSVLVPGGYQITGTKAVAFDETTDRYCAEYVPKELLAEDPQEVLYIIRLSNADTFCGFYTNAKKAIQQGVRVRIEDFSTGKSLTTSLFMGGEPPQTIRAGDSGKGTPPDAAAIEEWIRSAFAEILKSVPKELPTAPFNKEAATPKDKALYEARKLDRLELSRARLIEWLMEYEDCSEEDAEYAADHSGADWNGRALHKAQEYLSGKNENMWRGYLSRARVIEMVRDIGLFTEEEAEYAADHCGVDWKEQAVLEAKQYVDAGLSREELIHALTWNDYYGISDFTKEEAEYAADYYGLK